MGSASYIASSFLGGEWSVRAQGRIDAKDYRTAMNLCSNGLPIETGAWVRRPGFLNAGPTRGGRRARVIPFSFDQASPYTVELTDSAVRFRSGVRLTTTNDPRNIVSISAANPAVVTTSGNHGWSSGQETFFDLLGSLTPTLHNRQFLITVTGPTTFSLQDSIPNGFQATDVGRHVRWKVIPRQGYDSTVAYTTGDTVEWRGVSFVARKGSTGLEPPVTPSTSNSAWIADGVVNWMSLAAARQTSIPGGRRRTTVPRPATLAKSLVQR